MKVIWEGPETEDVWPSRILEDGSTENRIGGFGWESLNDPAMAELARRLLAEQAEQTKLDEHNDRLEEQAAPQWGTKAWIAHQHRLDEIGANLDNIHTRLNALSKGAEEAGERNHGCHAAYERLLAELLARVKKLEEVQEQGRPPRTAAGRAPAAETASRAAKLLAIEDALVHVEAARQHWLRLNSEGSCITDHLDLAVEVLEKASAK